MTILEKVRSLVKNGCDMESDNLEKLVYMAYYIGREAAAKETDNRYVKKISDMRERANACKYHKMANKIIGDGNFIYNPDFGGDMTSTFASDETSL
ncbi:MAG: hypothetical protein EOM59_13365 [Clostridia bacterium]|nr:hypothetical protein [Clostridia bacterium]